MTSAWSITASVCPPRSCFLDFPLGHTAGRPDHAEEQEQIMRDVLSAFASIDVPGTIRALPYAWGTHWKEGERATQADQRSARSATPQYQTEADRSAATQRFGEAVACHTLAPADVPTR